MSALDDLKDRIDSAIYTNTEQNITGDGLQTVLDDMVDTMGVSVSQNTETGKEELKVGSDVKWILDNVPEGGSDNLVKSGGVAALFPNMNTLASVDGLPNVNGIWYYGSGCKSVIIPVKGGEKYSISLLQTGYFAFITTDNFIDQVDYCAGTTTIRASNINGIVPSDCKNMIVTVKEDGNTFTFYKVIVDSYDYLTGATIPEIVKMVSSDYWNKLTERCIDKLNFFILENNYATQRKFGIDIDHNDVSVLYITFMSNTYRVTGKYHLKVTLYTNATITGEDFTQKGTGVVEVNKDFRLNNEVLQYYIFFGAGTYHCRIAEIELSAMDEDANNELGKYKEKLSDDPVIIDCWPVFDSTTEGYGVSRFASVVDANAYYRANIPNKKSIVLRCMPGLYDDFESKFGVNPADSVGIIIGSHDILLTSFDVDVPTLTHLKWDGSAEATASAMWNKAIFQMGGGGFVSIINGLYLSGKNLRYCMHPEDAGSGFDGAAYIKNCYITFEGRPALSETPPIVGTGIGCGHSLIFEDCKFEYVGIADPSTAQFIGGHNNGDDYKANHFISYGGKIHLKNCYAGGMNFSMQSISNDADTPFKLIFEGCSAINNVHTFPISESVENNFKIANICSDIDNIIEE